MKRPLIIFIFSAFAFLLISTAKKTSLVYDEIIYAPVGLLYWHTGDLHWNVEHPPLQKLLSAIPLLLKNIPIPNDLSPARMDEWRAGYRIIFQQITSPREIIFLSRFMSMAVAMGTVLLVYWWTKKRFGFWPGVVSLCVLAFDPIFIANGSLALGDIFVTFFFVAAYISFENFLDHPSTLRSVQVGMLAACTVTSKLSGLILFPSMFSVVVSRWKKDPVVCDKKFVRSVSAGILAFALFYLLVYRFQFSVIGASTLKEHSIEKLMTTPRYLLGALPQNFNWIYYPVAILIKTPLPLLMLWLLSLVLVCREKDFFKRKERFFLLVPVLIFFLLLISSQSRSGLRYFLPAVPCLAMFVGASFTLLRGRYETACIFLLLLAQIGETVRIHPHHMAYFNQLVGGSGQGWKWLDGSNQDWGQDLPTLASLLDQQKVRPAICMGYWGSNMPEAWGIPYQDVLSPAITNSFRKETVNPVDVPVEWLVVSAELRHNPSTKAAYAWLDKKEPLYFPGSTLFVYDISNDLESVLQLRNIYAAMGREKLLQRQLERTRWLRQ